MRLLLNCQRVLGVLDDPRMPYVVGAIERELSKWIATMDEPARQRFVDKIALTT